MSIRSMQSDLSVTVDDRAKKTPSASLPINVQHAQDL